MLTLVAPRGRPPKFSEPLITRHFDLPESLNALLVSAGRTKAQADIVRAALGEHLGKAKRETDIAAQLEGIEALIRRGAARAEAAQLPAVTLYQFPLDKAPCGAWREVQGELEAIEMPAEIADAMGAEEGDLLVTCDGQSMVGADIPDGTKLLMRPLRRNGQTHEPENGDVCLCQVQCDNGECVWTLKKWKWKGGSVELSDGQRKRMELPPRAETLCAVAFKVTALVKGRK